MSERGTTGILQPDPALVDPQALRSVCANWATGVTVITSGSTARTTGLTVNSFTSVSLDPALILVCIHNDSGELPVLRRTGAFAVNILAADQEELCRSFASRHTRHSAKADTRPGITGVPVLSDALAYLECRIEREVDAGDHVIVIGEVVDLAVQREEGPLTFFRNTFHRLPAAS
ncbi:flavin reductase family protein [Streptomyces chartreusis]|jgi:flavin reductase (DIM6/NTAB) family NADH-FMN oxidoreductase RutF|uniref:flavin reductase family protein n=1 Tax=Streptomyces TaxID=1883 RepID=UPI002E818E6B|nr:flavin reductase family protein [Streptomyces chartreusis]WTA28198.1 flavin reductase family protein [Streptomyces chartreusis]WUB18689.1 flavin reductase family protein [Streptomyces chartreusis]